MINTLATCCYVIICQLLVGEDMSVTVFKRSKENELERNDEYYNSYQFFSSADVQQTL